MTITYVIDTSVLLADPTAPTKFAEHEIVIPLVVLEELETKRHDPELGMNARRSLRYLERLRVEHQTLTDPILVNEHGGTLRIEINHQNTSGLPAVFQTPSNDHRILAVAQNLHNEHPDTKVVVVTKDLPLRLKAAIVGLGADEYRNEQAADTGFTGIFTIDTIPDNIDRIYHSNTLPMPYVPNKTFETNTGVILKHGKQSVITTTGHDGDQFIYQRVRTDTDIFGMRARSAEQHIAIAHLTNPDLGVISLGGPAGTGKTLLALAAGLDAVIEKRQHKRIMVFRPLYAVGGQDLGYLPGDATEKMDPWAAAIFDALEAIGNDNIIESAREVIEVLPLTFLRGRTLTDTFVIIDEAQNLERAVLLTALSRIGNNSRVVLCHDVAQRDNLHVGRWDGIMSVVEALRGESLFAHVTLRKTERSPIAAMCAQLLDDAA